MALIEVKAGAPELLSGPAHLNCSRKEEVRALSLILALGLVTLIAAYILWARVSGL